MPSAVPSAHNMNGFFADKAKYQAALTTRIFWIRLDDFTFQKRRFQFGDGQSIRKTLVIRMRRYLIGLTVYLSANEIRLEWHGMIIQQVWKTRETRRPRQAWFLNRIQVGGRQT